MNRVWVLFLGLFLFGATAVHAATIRIPLEKLTPADGIRLAGTSDTSERYNLTLPVPERWKVREATFSFRYVNSTALKKERSRLVFSVAGAPLGQITLDPQAPEGEVSVPIPGALLKPGYVPFGFSVAQHYSLEGCEDPTAPELWTRIDLRDASVTFDAELESVPLRVSAVTDFLFEPENPLPERLHIVIPDTSVDAMRRAGLVAAGVALRFQYRPVRMSVSGSLLPGADNIVIARLENAGPFLAGEQVEAEKALIRVAPLPPESPAASPDARHALILLSGRTDADVDRAVRSFALLSFPFPDTPVASPEEETLPAPEPYTFAGGLMPGRAYTFTNLGLSTVTFEGSHALPKGFSFRLPSDLHLSPNLYATLSLNLAYSAPMRADSALKILLNDKFVSTVVLDGKTGGVFRDYAVQVLLSSFQPGKNTITFAPVLTPLVTDQCTLIQDRQLALTLYGNSRLMLPEPPHWVEMPQLEAVMRDAFPFGRVPDLGETELVVTGADYPTVEAAVNLAALLAQKVGYPPFGLAWKTGAPGKTEKDVVVVGTAAGLSHDLLGKASIDITAGGRTPMPLLLRPRPLPETENTFWSGIRRLGRDKLPFGLAYRQEGQAATLRFKEALAGGRAALLEFQSPYRHDRTALVLTAAEPGEVALAAGALWEPAVQGAMAGGLALVNLKHPDFATRSLPAGASYYLGDAGPVPLMDYYANTHPVLSLVVLVAALVGVSILAYLLLRMIWRKRAGR